LKKQQWRGRTFGPVMALCLALAACSSTAIHKQSALRIEQLQTKQAVAELQVDADKELAAAVKGDKSLQRIQKDALSNALTPPRTVTLSDLMTAAMQHSSAIAAAAQGIDRSTVDHVNAVFGLLPQLSASYQADRLNEKVISTDNIVFEQGRANYPYLTTGVTLQQPLFDLSRLYGFQSAQNAKSKAEADYLAAIVDVSHQVFENYLTAVQSETRKRSLKEQGAFINRQVVGENSLQESGLGDEARLASMRSNHADLAADEALEAANYVEALSNLTHLTGLKIARVAPLTFPQKMLGIERSVDLEKAITDSLRESPTMISSRLKIAIAQKRKRQAWAEDYAPVLNGYVTFSDEDRDASRFGGGSHTQDVTFGVKLTVPLFNPRGAGYSGLAADMDVGAATIDYYSTSRQLEAKLRATYGRMGELTAALTALEAAVTQATSAYEAERAKLKNGQTVDLAVASRQLNLSKAIEKRAFYRMEYLRSWGELQFLMGKSLFREKF